MGCVLVGLVGFAGVCGDSVGIWRFTVSWR